jgi:hypothetical protein
LTSFYAKPYLDFRNLRGQVHEELVFTGNVAPIKPNDPRYRQVADSLRRLGAKILTTNETDSRLLRWYLSRTGYDLALAGGGLIALANSLTDQHPAHRVIFRDQIEASLNLKRESLPEYVTHMKKEIHEGRASPSLEQ